MIAPLLALLAAAKAAGLVAHAPSEVPKDLPGVPLLTVGERGLTDFRLLEDGTPVTARASAELLLVTALHEGAEAADGKLLALLALLPAHGFAPTRAGQVEATWGRREVIIARVAVTKTAGLFSS